MLTDYHLHTTFSADGKQSPDALCRSALAKGITHLAITDHVDICPNAAGVSYDINDPAAYTAAIDELRESYPQLCIQRGMELGYVPGYWNQAMERIRQVQPEFVLGSLHLVNKVDPYEACYFEKRTQREAYIAYLDFLLEAIPKLGQVAQVAAHIDYVSKYAPYPDRELRYEDYSQQLNLILEAVIKSGMALEINTSGYVRSSSPLPNASILKRYYLMGGRRITFGSDAHKSEFVGYELMRAQRLARDIGFPRHSIWIHGQEHQFHL